MKTPRTIPCVSAFRIPRRAFPSPSLVSPSQVLASSLFVRSVLCLDTIDSIRAGKRPADHGDMDDSLYFECSLCHISRTNTRKPRGTMSAQDEFCAYCSVNHLMNSANPSTLPTAPKTQAKSRAKREQIEDVLFALHRITRTTAPEDTPSQIAPVQIGVSFPSLSRHWPARPFAALLTSLPAIRGQPISRSVCGPDVRSLLSYTGLESSAAIAAAEYVHRA